MRKHAQDILDRDRVSTDTERQWANRFLGRDNFRFEYQHDAEGGPQRQANRAHNIRLQEGAREMARDTTDLHGPGFYNRKDVHQSRGVHSTYK